MAAVDSANEIIVAYEVSDNPADSVTTVLTVEHVEMGQDAPSLTPQVVSEFGVPGK